MEPGSNGHGMAAHEMGQETEMAMGKGYVFIVLQTKINGKYFNWSCH